MNISAPFIKRPIGTSLLAAALLMAGALAFNFLPVAPLPQVEFPVISVSAGLPGASPETMASAVATPLERQFGRIAGINQMTSTSQLGSTNIVLQFDLSRNIDAAGRDVQAAINAARSQLPANLPGNPNYRKVNPADAPILILALTSDVLTLPRMYDAADSILSQKLAQIEGVGQVFVGGGAKPAVRAELNPTLLNKLGVGLDTVRTALNSANANRPKGELADTVNAWTLGANDQIFTADQYRRLIVSYKNGAPVRLGDVGAVQDSVEDIRNVGLSSGRPAVLIIINRQPGANIIATVDRVVAALPLLKSSISPAIDVNVVMDRTTTVRASVHDIEVTLLISVVLVILVVFVFLRTFRATIIPSVAVPLSLIATFGVMYLLGYSLDNLSLMALAISTGFVVDDAIVVLENITRHTEEGMPPVAAAFQGAREIGFTVLSMSTSLIAVFIPILLMGGIVGRLFREFAVTLSVAIMISLAVSLATTPMMCALLLRRGETHEQGRFHRVTEWCFDAMLRGYRRTLGWALDNPRVILAILLTTVATNFYLYTIVPKGFFPQQDTGRINGGIQADQSISFQLMRQKLQQFVSIIQKDPAVDTVVGFTGGGQTNGGFVFMSLKPLSERKISADLVIRRLRGELAQVPGATLFLQAVQDIRVGGRNANAQYQFSLQADTVAELYEWAPKILAELQKVPQLTDVNSDQQNKGLETDITIDRETAARLGISVAQIDNTLYDAFGQRQVSTIYNDRNQYHVIMEVAPKYWQNAETLKDIYVSKSGGSVGGTQATNAVAGTVAGPKTTSTSSTIAANAARNLALNSIGNTGKGAASTGSAVSTAAETMVPLSAVTHYAPGNIPLAVNHQGLFVASTMSFNLAPGSSLSDAVATVNEVMTRLGVPRSIHGTFQGTARAYEQSLRNQPWLILAALIAIYIVLGVLYESYIHPITILSTLPSAGVGAVLALMICNTEFSIMGLIGVILLIGLVKKNAIMMIDFALDGERTRGLTSQQAIYEACLLRFRPIMMTTSAAMFGALPLAIGLGDGGELRRPLGIAIVGGLILSQLLTLYTTPVVYLYLDRFSLWVRDVRGKGPAPDIPHAPLVPGE